MTKCTVACTVAILGFATVCYAGARQTGSDNGQPQNHEGSYGAIFGPVHNWPETGAAAANAEKAGRAVKMQQQARRLLRQGNTKKALQTCLQAITALHEVNRPTLLEKNLLADIYLESGEYQKALDLYRANYKNLQSGSINLNVALAFARLNDYANAKRFYSDKSILEYTNIKADALPGAQNLHALEASILLARGLDHSMTREYKLALRSLEPAAKLAPAMAILLL